MEIAYHSYCRALQLLLLKTFYNHPQVPAGGSSSVETGCALPTP